MHSSDSGVSCVITCNRRQCGSFVTELTELGVQVGQDQNYCVITHWEHVVV